MVASKMKVTAKAAKKLADKLDKIQYGLTAAPKPAITNGQGVTIGGMISAPSTVSGYDSEEDSRSYYYHDRAEKLVEDIPTEAESEVKKEDKVSEKVVVAKKLNGFETFSTTQTLPEGLCIVRSLGFGKYELVNLKDISLDTLRSDGAGLQLATNMRRANAFHIRGSTWIGAVEKCALASRYSDKHVFTFTKLPAELRVKILELVVIAPRGIGRRTYYHFQRQTATAINCMLVSKQFYQESRPIFWCNNFKIEEFVAPVHLPLTDFTENVQQLTYVWRGKIRETSNFIKIATFPKLKYFTLEIGYGCEKEIHRSSKGNKLHQDEQSIKLFSGQNGFDKLVKIRGLKEVKVIHHWPQKLGPLPSFIVDTRAQAAKDLETLLNRVLTQPKIEKRIRKRYPRKPKVAATS